MTGDRRWPWFKQTREAVVSLVGVAILATMTVRNSWPPMGVVVAMTCLGIEGSAALMRFLIGRWENGGNGARKR